MWTINSFYSIKFRVQNLDPWTSKHHCGKYETSRPAPDAALCCAHPCGGGHGLIAWSKRAWPRRGSSSARPAGCFSRLTPEKRRVIGFAAIDKSGVRSIQSFDYHGIGLIGGRVTAHRGVPVRGDNGPPRRERSLAGVNHRSWRLIAQLLNDPDVVGNRGRFAADRGIPHVIDLDPAWRE
jgi:hypothetical protein